MNFKLFAAVIFALPFFAPSPALAACCEHQHHAADINVLSLVPIDTQIAQLPAARQEFEVWFKQPTWIGKAIVQGRYVIEHDNDRMARGEPCTHVYAYADRETPVATFHCTHLERARATQNSVGLITTSDGFKRLTEFQFAGESAAHGHPAVR